MSTAVTVDLNTLDLHIMTSTTDLISRGLSDPSTPLALSNWSLKSFLLWPIPQWRRLRTLPQIRTDVSSFRENIATAFSITVLSNAAEIAYAIDAELTLSAHIVTATMPATEGPRSSVDASSRALSLFGLEHSRGDVAEILLNNGNSATSVMR